MADRVPLQVEIELVQREFALAINFQAAAPWTCLFGASGSGKTTILRTIAGFIKPQTGKIVLGNAQVLFDQATHTWLPANQRPVRTASQQARLFPGTVNTNVRYAVAPRTTKSAVDDILRRFRLEALSEARVERLSGGEQQRVSLARAVAAALLGKRPAELLLLDEPFAGIDTRLRDVLAPELRDWFAQQKLQVLSVTHDVPEAFLLNAEIVRIAGGRVLAQGPARDVLAEDRERLHAILR